MESAHDSIKYIYPVYTADAQHGENGALNRLGKKAKYTNDDILSPWDDAVGETQDATLTGEAGDAMYEQTESRYATELVLADATGSDKVYTCEVPALYIDGDAQVLVDGEVVAMEVRSNGTDYKWIGDASATVDRTAGTATVTFKEAPTVTDKVQFICRYDSEKDLDGKYLGEVELQMRDYHFRPRPITLGVTWTQLTELVLDTSFGLSAEEMLMDAAAQEIKKTLDYQAVKYAKAVQAIKASGNVATFNAEAGNDTKDSYFHTAQTIQQSISRIADKQLNAIGRGGVSAIMAGPAACNYLMLNKDWTDKGKQPAIGGHKMGELGGKIWNASNVKVA